MVKPSYLTALDRLGMMSAMAGFDPRVAGTVPLALDLPTSDIDILCHALDPHAFTAAVWAAFSDCAGFAIWQWIGTDRPVVASFEAEGWAFELFGQVRPVAEQVGWRHFLIEKRLLELGGDGFRAAIMKRRRSGMKTEPAFADVLNLSGNPYQALLEIESWSNDALTRLLTNKNAVNSAGL